MQVEAGLQVPTCGPGLVRKADRQYPPPAAKWETVDIAARVKYHPCRRLDKQARGPSYVVDRTHLEELDDTPLTATRTCALAGVACSAATPMVSARTQYVQFKALCARVFRTPKHRPEPKIFQLLWRFVPLLLPDFKATPMPFYAWLATCRAGRRAAMLIAKERYDNGGWRKAYAKFKAFVKEEMLPDFTQVAGDTTSMRAMVDRIIQAPHDVTHIIAGPVLKPLLGKLKELWGVNDPIFYGSTVPEKLDQWLQRLHAAQGTYFTCDYSMFDSTHSEQSWRFLERLYQPSAAGVCDWHKVMDAWRKPVGSIGPYTYEAPIMNASGRADTALANAILNGLVMYVSTVAAYLSKPLEELSVADVSSCRDEVFISICGDDSLGRVPPMTVDQQNAFGRALTHNVSRFGFETKLQVLEELEDCVYLGNRPYPVDGRYYWGRTVGRSTYKLGWVVDPRGRDLMAHITGVAAMHAKCSSHVPVLYDLCERITQLRAHAKRTPIRVDPDKPWEWTMASGKKYTHETIESFVRVMNRSRVGCAPSQPSFTVQEVYQLIAEIHAIPQLPYVLDSAVWRRIICYDEL